MYDCYQPALKIWKMVLLETLYQELNLETFRSIPLPHINRQLDQKVQLNQPTFFWLNYKNIDYSIFSMQHWKYLLMWKIRINVSLKRYLLLLK